MALTGLRLHGARVLAPFVAAALLILALAASESVAQSATPGVSHSFRLGGRVDNPKTYRLADLQARPAHTVSVSFIGPGGLQSHSFTGALLSDLVAAAAPQFDTARKNDFLRWTARVHATDNYEVVVAFGEFDPHFENKQVLIAYADNGQLLTDTGFARLVVPDDIRGGRYVSNVNLIALNPPSRGGIIPFPSRLEDD